MDGEEYDVTGASRLRLTAYNIEPATSPRHRPYNHRTVGLRLVP